MVQDNDTPTIFKTAAVVAGITGVVIFSAVFTAGSEPGSGPGLLFETLPTLLSAAFEALERVHAGDDTSQKPSAV